MKRVKIYPCASFVHDRSPHVCISTNGVYLKPVIDKIRKKGVITRFSGTFWEVFIDYDSDNVDMISRMLTEYGVCVVIDENALEKIRWYVKKQFGKLFCKYGINELCYRFSRLPR